jgi:hypothetical protein
MSIRAKKSKYKHLKTLNESLLKEEAECSEQHNNPYTGENTYECGANQTCTETFGANGTCGPMGGMTGTPGGGPLGMDELDKQLGDEEYLTNLFSSMKSSEEFISWFNKTYGSYREIGLDIPTGEKVIADLERTKGRMHEGIPAWMGIIGGIFGLITSGIKAWTTVQGFCCDSEPPKPWCCWGGGSTTGGPRNIDQKGELNEGCGCGGSKETSEDSYMAASQLHSISNKAQDMYGQLEKDEVLDDWVESHLAKIDQMMDSVSDSFNHDQSKDAGDMGPGGCPPGHHWCTASNSCRADNPPQTEPLTLMGADVVNLEESIRRKLTLTEQAQNNARRIQYRSCSGSMWSSQNNVAANGQVPEVGDILRINTNSSGTGSPRTVMVLDVLANTGNSQFQNAQCQPTCPNCSVCFNWTTMQNCDGTTGDPDCVVTSGTGSPGNFNLIECGSCGCDTNTNCPPPLGPNTHWCMSDGSMPTTPQPWVLIPPPNCGNGYPINMGPSLAATSTVCPPNQQDDWWCDPTGAYVSPTGGSCLQSPNQPQSYFTGPYPTEQDCINQCTSTTGCDQSAWANYSNWLNNFTSLPNFTSTNPNQPCQFLCQRNTQWSNQIQNVGPQWANQLQCKLDEVQSLMQQHNCSTSNASAC